MSIEMNKIFEFLSIDHFIIEPNNAGVTFEENKILVNYWDESGKLNNKQVGDITRSEIEKSIDIIKSTKTLTKEDDIYSLHYIEPYLIQIPHSNNHIVMNKVGAYFFPIREIAKLWTERIPYVLNKQSLHYTIKNDSKRIDINTETNIDNIPKMFARIAWDTESYQSVCITEKSTKNTHTETVTLPNGDLIIMHLEKGCLIELKHMMK